MRLLAATLLAAIGLLLTSCSGTKPPAMEPDNSMVVMSANLTSGNLLQYEEEGIRLIQSIKPDIAIIQEFAYGSGSLRDLVDSTLSEDYYYTVGAGLIPNGIISIYPILSSSYWDDPNISNRDIDWAILDIPGDRDVMVVSCHFSTTTSHQVDAMTIIANQISAHKTANPKRYYYVVGGTFNITSLANIDDINVHDDFDISGPFPVDKYGDSDTNSSRSSPFDCIVLGSSLSHYEVPFSQNGSGSYANGFVLDSRIYTQTELDQYFPPVQVSDSGATNMQHMAVIKKIVIE